MAENRKDSGWSWVISLSCCFCHLVLHGVTRLSGMLLTHFVTNFNVNRTLASLPFSVCNAVMFLSGPLVGFLGERYSIRAVTLPGCIMASLGVGLCYLAGDIVWATVFWGLLFGMGNGFGTTLLPHAINQNFEKYLSTASGISYSGAYIGSFVLPPILSMAIEEYGFSGSFLILSSILLQSVIAAMFLRPPDCKEIPAAEETKSQNADKFNYLPEGRKHGSNSALRSLEGRCSKRNVVKSESLFGPLSRNRNSLIVSKGNCDRLSEALNRKLNDSLRADNAQTFSKRKHTSLTDLRTHNICGPSNYDCIFDKKVLHLVSDWSPEEVILLPSDLTVGIQTQTEISDETRRHELTCNSRQSWRFQRHHSEPHGRQRYRQNLRYGGADNLAATFDEDEFENKSIRSQASASRYHQKITSSPTNSTSAVDAETVFKQRFSLDFKGTRQLSSNSYYQSRICSKNVFCRQASLPISPSLPQELHIDTAKNESFSTKWRLPSETTEGEIEISISYDSYENESRGTSSITSLARVFVQPMFIVISFTYSMYYFVRVCLFTVIGDYAADIGTAPQNVHLALMTLSIADLIGTLGFGWITDKKYLTRRSYMVLCFFMMSIALTAMAFTTDWTTLFAAVSIYGVFESSALTMFPLLIAQYIPTEMQASSIASNNLLVAPTMLLISFAIGFFRDRLGSYVGMFYLLAGISAVCSASWIVLPTHLHKQRCEKTSQVMPEFDRA